MAEEWYQRVLPYVPPHRQKDVSSVFGDAFQGNDRLRRNSISGWLITRNDNENFVAHFVASTPTAYVVVAKTLADLYTYLPLGPQQPRLQLKKTPEATEAWFLKTSVV